MSLADEFDRVVRIRIGGVKFAVARGLERFVVETMRRAAFEVVTTAAEMTEVMIEAARDRIPIEVPLAHGERVVARRLHGLPHRQPALHTESAVLPILPAHQGGACRLALRGIVEGSEAQPSRREPVQIRRRNLTAVAAEVRESHVIGKDEEDVDLFRWRVGGANPQRLEK